MLRPGCSRPGPASRHRISVSVAIPSRWRSGNAVSTSASYETPVEHIREPTNSTPCTGGNSGARNIHDAPTSGDRAASARWSNSTLARQRCGVSLLLGNVPLSGVWRHHTTTGSAHLDDRHLVAMAMMPHPVLRPACSEDRTPEARMRGGHGGTRRKRVRACRYPRRSGGRHAARASLTSARPLQWPDSSTCSPPMSRPPRPSAASPRRIACRRHP